MEFVQKNKNAVIVFVILLVIVGIGMLLTGGKGDDSADSGKKDSTLPDVQVLPTVDPSVEVNLEADTLGQEVTLSIENYPDGTEEIEYELSYDALVDGESIPKGVIGSIKVENGLASKDITLGTCSSGVCKYDKGVSLIKVTLKFTGDYGAQLYEGEFEI